MSPTTSENTATVIGVALLTVLSALILAPFLLGRVADIADALR